MNVHSDRLVTTKLQPREELSMSATQTILITGATAGIGRYTALHLARRGHHVIASGRSANALASLKAEAGGARLDTLSLDVNDAASIAAAVREVDRLTGGRGIDTLVNNAGYGIAVPIDEISDADLRAQFETNVFGLVAMVRAFVPKMRARGRGRIVNVASIGGKMTVPFLGAYNATKHAVESLSDAMRYELRPFGIETVIVEPGGIRTNFATRTIAESTAYQRADSPYANAYATYQRLVQRADELAPGPIVVARAIERAATARRPRARYVVPFVGGRLLLGLVQLLPTRLVDWMFARMLGLTSKKLALTARAEVPTLSA
jgi:NAD(P)-dependent dehydrogenase (short-subunit alcohol dehydrogenase family)